MAFRLYATDDGHVPAWEYLPADSIKPQVGMGLVLNTNGKLAISNQPSHICMCTIDKYLDSGTEIPVVKIAPDQVWENQIDAATTFTIGDKVDITASGIYIDADASTNGNFLITYLAGQAMGDVVRGRFVK